MDKIDNTIGMLKASVRSANKKYIPNATVSVDFINEAVEFLEELKSSKQNERDILIKFLMEIDECYSMHVREYAEKCVDDYLNTK